MEPPNTMVGNESLAWSLTSANAKVCSVINAVLLSQRNWRNFKLWSGRLDEK